MYIILNVVCVIQFKNGCKIQFQMTWIRHLIDLKKMKRKVKDKLNAFFVNAVYSD